MPSVSAKQRRFMAAAAHNKAFAKKAGIAPSVAKEFHAADRRDPASFRATMSSKRRKR